jgi:Cystine-knot domain
MSMTYYMLFTFILCFHSQIFSVVSARQTCLLENRTMILNVCKTPPRLTLPVCGGFCSSHSQWDFRLNRYVHGISACTVIEHRTEQFICPDASHTAVEIMIPLACSCTKYSCHNDRFSHRYTKLTDLYW